MLKEESHNVGCGESSRARGYDTCQSAACTVYCRADSAYLCTSCDAEVHSANRVASRHKRVRVCDSCERAPAAFLCEADDASLCTACDLEVHSANPVARRHHRVPILPISGNSYSSLPTHHQSDPENKVVVVEGEDGDEEDRDAAAWLLPENSGNNDNNHNNNGFMFGDENLNFMDYNSSMEYKFTGQYNQHEQDCGVPQANYGGDGVVPLKVEELRSHPHHKEENFQFDVTYGTSASQYNYNGSLNHNAYISSMETRVVPDSTARDTTLVHQRAPKGTIDQVPGPTQMITQLSPMEREARVLRYREKKKTRKFEKTIRYASRKAYAEKRPRINGRFAKRRENEAEAEQAFNTMLMSDTGYGIVPSFRYSDCKYND